MEDKLDIFVRRLKKIGIETDYFANYPWIYFNSINGKRVTEKFQSDYGFVVGYRNKGFTFEDLTKIFELLRKYKDV